MQAGARALTEELLDLPVRMSDAIRGVVGDAGSDANPLARQARLRSS
jgi:hypothetical protein